MVVIGFNRFVRSPMYFGPVVALLGYAAVVWRLPASFVRVYEEPALAPVRRRVRHMPAQRAGLDTASTPVDTRTESGLK
ncbi:hypothetical protein GCM10023321_27420 [Pseudonocardia eucalypti]|uniref:Uncharacterized protein n=1 Tax=Pseudonocardia eucalypti TaxID=648755 RepID=A0ABP9Q6Q8_9PSEU